jgi:phosphoribosyl 1,2-cyclic phosphodiesterase
MKIKFWGVRGSIASPVTTKQVRKKIEDILEKVSPKDIQSPDSIKRFLDKQSFSSIGTYGGNTTCIEVRDSQEKLYIIDAGTGLRELGNQLLPHGFGTGKGQAYWLFTHTHWDHLQGIPFFVPVYIPGNVFDIYTCVENLETKLAAQHMPTHFPVPFDYLKSTRNYHQFLENEKIGIGNINVSAKSVRHPGGNFSFKLEEGEKKFIFASDAEFNLDEMENIESYLDFFHGADVLVFDTQYTFEDSLNKIDWGHSSASIATDIALKAKVKKLVMFHHDPSYDDEKLDAVFLRALSYKGMMDRNNELEIIMAYEGLELEI